MTYDAILNHEEVVRARLARGMTQDELAQRVGVSRKTINNFENGRHQPQAAHRRAIREALDLHDADARTDARADIATGVGVSIGRWPEDVQAFTLALGDYLANLSPAERGHQFARWMMPSIPVPPETRGT